MSWNTQINLSLPINEIRINESENFLDPLKEERKQALENIYYYGIKNWKVSENLKQDRQFILSATALYGDEFI